MGAEIDDAGLQAGEDVDLAAQLAAAEDLDLYRTVRLCLHLFGEMRQDGAQRMSRHVGISELEAARGRGGAPGQEGGRQRGSEQGKRRAARKLGHYCHSLGR